MKRYFFVLIFLFIIGLAGNSVAADKQPAKDNAKTQSPAVKEEDREIIEMADLLNMMEFVEDMEFMQALNLFMEEKTDEKGK